VSISLPFLPREAVRRPGAAAARVLLAGTDADLALGLRQALELDGREVELVRDRRLALRTARRLRPTLLIAGAELLTAPDLLQTLRRDHPELPVLIIGRRPLAAHCVPGFRLGLDEFIIWPMPLRELHTRIDGMLARGGCAAEAAPRPREQALRFGSVEVDPRGRQVLREGRPVALRPREFELLLALVRRQGEAVSRSELLRDVWGYSDSVVTRTVDSHIVQLRRKLEQEPTRPAHIITVPTIGYRLDPGADHPCHPRPLRPTPPRRWPCFSRPCFRPRLSAARRCRRPHAGPMSSSCITASRCPIPIAGWRK
jgi:DNA-binding response OmpR family regulator